jgi:hypothetical protein
VSLFQLVSVNWTHVRDRSFTEKDLKHVIQLLQPNSFKVSIQNEVYETLNKVQESLIDKLDKYDSFSNLACVELKRRVVLGLLLPYLPAVAKERLSQQVKT